MPDLKASHLRQLCPIVLEAPLWALLKNQPLDMWQELKQAVEERLGLTKNQLLDCFYGMRQGKIETSSQFILQIEDKSLQLGVQESTCYQHLTSLLDEDKRACLDAVCELKGKLGSTTTGLLTWESLVSREHFGTTCSKLAPSRHAFHITGFGP